MDQKNVTSLKRNLESEVQYINDSKEVNEDTNATTPTGPDVSNSATSPNGSAQLERSHSGNSNLTHSGSYSNLHKRLKRELSMLKDEAAYVASHITPKTDLLPPEPSSELQSPVYGLTLYEVHRQPRTPVTDDSTTTIQVRNLNIELTCAVCLGILHDTMTVMECLHRFCAGCISKSLRLGKKECPTCRVKCPSKRYLRPDPNFDGLISQIYPNLDEYEAKQDSLIENLNKSFLQKKHLIESVEEGKKRQAAAKSARPKKPATPEVTPQRSVKTNYPSVSPGALKLAQASPSTKSPSMLGLVRSGLVPNLTKIPSTDLASSPAVSSSTPQKEAVAPNEISFVLIRHPDEEKVQQLANKYLRTSKLLTVRHLCKFLSKKLNYEDFKAFSLSLPSKPSSLPDDITLDTISKEYWKNPEELTLYYKVN